MLMITMIHNQAAVVHLYIIISLFSISRVHATFIGNETDRQALMAIKQSILQDPQKALNSWNDSFHFCQWEGVTCGRRHHQRVTRLSLISRGLGGPLNPYVGNLSFLQILELNNNSLSGEIPPQLGHLFRLKVLNVHLNNFEGKIPVNISSCSNLTVLGVGRNNLVGELPEELSALSKLKALVVEDNRFTGRITPFLGNLTLLQIIYARGNLFSGNIPDTICQLKRLRVIGLATNNLSGMIPPSFYNLSLLTTVSLDQNQLRGSLPPSIGSMMPRLQTIQLNNNWLTGSLPLSLSNCSALQVLQLDYNNFDGKVAINFGVLNDISHIRLDANNFGSGEIDEMNFIGSTINCTNLHSMSLSANRFRGVLPNSIGNLSNQLSFLNLGGNLLYGRLPSTIGNLVNLETLGVDSNQFTGTIPHSIGNLRSIKMLVLADNKFSGKIPDSIGNLSLVIKLYMNINRLEGSIPASLGSCHSLLLLELSENNLSGPIPKQLFKLSAISITLNLSGNHLVGLLPVEVGSLKVLGSLDLSKNSLSGEIPSSVGSCTSLENLLLQENIFQGSIPLSLSDLKGLINLDLSHNNFSGQIPIFFEQFLMQYLNLSFNNFEGDVPMRGVFSNQSAISVVGNKKLCGGMPALHLRKCSSEKSKKRQGRHRALVIVISIISALLGVTVMCCFLFSHLVKRKKVRPSAPKLKESFLRVSYEKLHKATDGFSSEHMVGRGSFSSVYKGILDVDAAVVAVKVLNLQSQGSSKSFMIECEALRHVRHRNLVRIITSCSSVDFHGNEFKALVYEFMPNGNLETWLHSSQHAHVGDLQKINLLQRINIIIDVACALDYLHNQCENPIIHCDLKPSNILLDQDMVAHVGDFGLAKFILPELAGPSQYSSIGLRGTIGYAAPEYGIGSEISAKGDLYSFGIIVLEMITGKRPTDPMFEEGLTLHNFAKMSLADSVLEVVDPMLRDNIQEEDKNGSRMAEGLMSMIKIGVACSMESAENRMDISNVLNALHSVQKILQGTLNDSNCLEYIE